MTTPTSHRGSRGISTAEILVGASISLVLLSVAQSYFVTQQRMLLVQSAYAQSQNVTRTFTDLLSRELRMASYDPSGTAITLGASGAGVTCPSVRQGITEATPTSVQFLSDLNGDGDTADSNENVRYALSGTQIQRTDGGGAALTLVDGVPSGGLVFTYYNNSNPPTELTPSGNPLAVSASNRDCIAKVRVRVTAQLSDPQFTNINPLVSAIESEVAIRNRS
ncbi:MAG: hypothetical protein ACREQL_11785, partial [Candidatus Binatia bacterium]